MFKGVFRTFTAGLVAVTMLGSSAAMAAPLSTPSISTISPIVALSFFASSQSRDALCGAAAAAAVGAAVSQAGPPQGCVLPAVDAVPVVAEVPQAVPVAVAQGGGISPLLLGLGAIALGIGLWALLRDNDNDNPTPESP